MTIDAYAPITCTYVTDGREREREGERERKGEREREHNTCTRIHIAHWHNKNITKHTCWKCPSGDKQVAFPLTAQTERVNHQQYNNMNAHSYAGLRRLTGIARLS